MTVYEAYSIIKKKNGNKVLTECYDTKDFFAFGFCTPEMIGVPVGGGYWTVKKNDGSIGKTSYVVNMEAFDNSTPIDIRLLDDFWKTHNIEDYLKKSLD